ncbi:protein kinase [Candidatus Sumerlaeota bacterium]|nr:protein kinase [Candidatus Sumerlaeota bacterium]
MSDLIGHEIRGYRVVREIARGGMAVVFEAEQVRLGRPVAIKMLHPALTVDSDFLRRFEREARTLARLNHENIVNVIDFFEHDDRYFLALEFVEGETLARRLRRCARHGRFFSVGEATAIAWQIAQALAFAHSREIVHRDLKPENIMLTARQRAKVMDFGIARAIGHSPSTEVGTRVGTPDYMAPEQLRGEGADARSDLFALGLIYYEMLSGHRPFSQGELLKAKDDQRLEIPWPQTDLPPGSDRLGPIFDRLLAPRPGDRYPSAGDLLEDMRQRLGVELLGDVAWTTPPPTAVPTEAIAEQAAAPSPAVARRTRLKQAVVIGAIIAMAATIIAVAVIAGMRWEHAREQQIANEQEERARKLEATIANFQAFIADSQGRVSEAETLFLRAIDVAPTVSRYWRDLGDFYDKNNQPSKAIYYYRKTLELDPSDEETSRRLRQLDVPTTVSARTF